MGKFNTNAEGRVTNTVNRAGGAAYQIKDGRKELASVVLASMLNGDKYYESDASRINRVFDLVKAGDREFAAKAMIYTRQEGNLRSISHVLANAIVENASGAGYLRSAIKKAIVRPDDMTEMAALWFSRNQGKMLPNSMRRAFKDLLESNKWDAYQLRKYLKPNSNVKLRDIVLLTHPRDERGLLKGVIEGTLKAPETLETKLASGVKASDAFETMLRENRLGYMAAVKNIRNALESGISDEALVLWGAMITNPDRIRKSRMLPFRYIDAWEAVKGLQIDTFKKRIVKNAFNRAMINSAENLGLADTNDKIALVIDESGSMSEEFYIGLTIAAVLYHALPKNNVVVYFFDDKAREVDFGGKMPLDILESYSPRGGATYFDAPLKLLTNTNTKVNKIILFTDMQLYDGWGDHKNFEKYLSAYKSKVGNRVQTLFWDLRGYGASTPLELREDVLLASGFSDKLLSVIPKLWKDENALVKEIDEISLT